MTASKIKDRIQKVHEISVNEEKTKKPGLLSSIWEVYRTKWTMKPKNQEKSKDKLPGSIYPLCDGTIGGQTRRFIWVHYVLKYKIFKPFLYIVEKFILHKLDDKLDDGWHNRNLRVFDTSWKEACKEMAKLYNIVFLNHRDYELVRRMILTFSTFDTATREFMNILMHSIAKNMQNEYKGHKKVYHMIYTSRNIYDVAYFRLGEFLFDKNIDPEVWRDQQRGKFIKELNVGLKEEAKLMLANQYANFQWIDLKPGLRRRLSLAYKILTQYKTTVRLAVKRVPLEKLNLPIPSSVVKNSGGNEDSPQVGDS